MKRILKLTGIALTFILLCSMRLGTKNAIGSSWITEIVDKLEVSDYFLTTTPDGNLVITGSFTTKARFGNKALVSAGGYDIFTAKYSQDGNLMWLKQGGGSEFDMANIIRVDTVGNVYVTGYITGIAFFGDYIVRSKGQRNVFTIKYDRDGEIQWLKAEGADLYYESNPKKKKKIMAKILN